MTDLRSFVVMSNSLIDCIPKLPTLKNIHDVDQAFVACQRSILNNLLTSKATTK